ncbi:MAG: hypothetical protein K2X77_10140 [Candidatus Obscuribacterales bacterium]|jgi:hypothetical protein|nr:hypothetical protein [Candidatus Obscuribacterales bacterium]
MKKRKHVEIKIPIERAFVLKGQKLEILSRAEFEAITKANYYHPESRLILQLFLQVHYAWQISKLMQGKASTVKTIDWSRFESACSKLLLSSFGDLLSGVQVSPWTKQVRKKA